jgi:hypothetical protein
MLGCLLAIIFVLLVAKPIYDSMYEDIFLKIGGNENVWSKNKNI